MKNERIGSSFDDFLEDEGILTEGEAEAIKRIISWQISEYLKESGIKKSVFAKTLGTSRSQLDRLLDPENTSLNLNTLTHAVKAMGKKVEFKLI
jgi:predicted XRE-type DNA-binding protein